MFDISPSELIIILLIVALVFGPGRISKTAGELGKAIHAFREGLKSQTEPDSKHNSPDEALETGKTTHSE